jgi:hypothetical protein
VTVVVPLSGLAGWNFLQRTASRQTATLAETPEARRSEAWFRERIGKIDTAEQLVADRRLLDVALTAFGLEQDINSRFFIRKVLEDGTLRPDALANRLGNKQYRALSAAFGFGDVSPPRNKLSDFADRILAQVRARRFESAVGQQDNSLRLALNFDREITSLATRRSSPDAVWFTLLGTPPLREVMDKALGLPTTFRALDVDRQLAVYKDRARDQFGIDSPSALADPGLRRQVIEAFLLRDSITAAPTGPGSGALRLLQARL